MMMMLFIFFRRLSRPKDVRSFRRARRTTDRWFATRRSIRRFQRAAVVEYRTTASGALPLVLARASSRARCRRRARSSGRSRSRRSRSRRPWTRGRSAPRRSRARTRARAGWKEALAAASARATREPISQDYAYDPAPEPPAASETDDRDDVPESVEEAERLATRRADEGRRGEWAREREEPAEDRGERGDVRDDAEDRRDDDEGDHEGDDEGDDEGDVDDTERRGDDRADEADADGSDRSPPSPSSSAASSPSASSSSPPPRGPAADAPPRRTNGPRTNSRRRSRPTRPRPPRRVHARRFRDGSANPSSPPTTRTTPRRTTRRIPLEPRGRPGGDPRRYAFVFASVPSRDERPRGLTPRPRSRASSRPSRAAPSPCRRRRRDDDALGPNRPPALGGADRPSPRFSASTASRRRGGRRGFALGADACGKSGASLCSPCGAAREEGERRSGRSRRPNGFAQTPSFGRSGNVSDASAPDASASGMNARAAWGFAARSAVRVVDARRAAFGGADDPERRRACVANFFVNSKLAAERGFESGADADANSSSAPLASPTTLRDFFLRSVLPSGDARLDEPALVATLALNCASTKRPKLLWTLYTDALRAFGLEPADAHMSVGPAQVAADADALLGLRLADLNARRDAAAKSGRWFEGGVDDARATKRPACPKLRGEGGEGATTEPKTKTKPFEPFESFEPEPERADDGSEEGGVRPGVGGEEGGSEAALNVDSLAEETDAGAAAFGVASDEASDEFGSRSEIRAMFEANRDARRAAREERREGGRAASAAVDAAGV